MDAVCSAAPTLPCYYYHIPSMNSVDLDMLEFVELESVAKLVKLYNVFYNVVVLCSLFSMLQYTGLVCRPGPRSPWQAWRLPIG